MDKYVVGVIIAVFGAMTVAVVLGLRFSQATLIFGFIAAVSARIVVHRIPDKNWALGGLLGLAIFASFPLRELYQISNFLGGLLVILIYMAILWVVGLGWKRSWR